MNLATSQRNSGTFFHCKLHFMSNISLEHGSVSVCTELTFCGYGADEKLPQTTGDWAHYKYQDIAHSVHLTGVKHLECKYTVGKYTDTKQ
jgi:hypothetical protein